MAIKFLPLKLPGSFRVELAPMHDDRGYFMRAWDDELYRENGLTASWVQENQSLSNRKGIIRGLHFQKPPHSETKLVRAVVGTILDVFVDLRKDSPTYGQWDSVELSAENHTAAYVPKGFAHGFCTLTEVAVVVYKVDAKYAPGAEGGLRWDDETLNIAWPLRETFLSPKDKALPAFKDFVSPF